MGGWVWGSVVGKEVPQRLSDVTHARWLFYLLPLRLAIQKPRKSVKLCILDHTMANLCFSPEGSLFTF